MKLQAFYFGLLGSVVIFAFDESKAQDTLTAGVLIDPPFSYLGGYIDNAGIGWEFTPTEDLLITTIYSSTGPSHVSFWQGTSYILSDYVYNSQGGFQSIPPLLLSAGQNYAISTQNSDFLGTVPFKVGSPSGAFSLGVVSISQYISYFGSYSVSPSEVWSPFSDSPDDNSDFICVGPNFQFQVVPEPSTIGIMILGLVFWGRKFSQLN